MKNGRKFTQVEKAISLHMEELRTKKTENKKGLQYVNKKINDEIHGERRKDVLEEMNQVQHELRNEKHKFAGQLHAYKHIRHSLNTYSRQHNNQDVVDIEMAMYVRDQWKQYANEFWEDLKEIMSERTEIIQNIPYSEWDIDIHRRVRALTTKRDCGFIYKEGMKTAWQFARYLMSMDMKGYEIGDAEEWDAIQAERREKKSEKSDEIFSRESGNSYIYM